MTPQDITLMIGAIGAFAAVVGAGVKWLLSHIEDKALDSSHREEIARSALSDRLQDEIDDLRLEIGKFKAEKSLYLKRIYQLEFFIHRLPGVDIPNMDGWPPS